MKLENLEARVGGRLLFSGFTSTLERGDRVGVIGPNGCGKTTLLRLLLDEGPGVRHGANLRFAYADQIRAALDDNATVRDTISSEEFVEINGSRRHVMGYLGDFLFTPDRARQKVGVLSGGERNRLLLAKIFAVPSNLLVLDEPTNDLDLDTLDILEDCLAAYEGTVLLVSHDREFLNHTATRIWSFENDPDGVPRVMETPGNHDDYMTARARNAPAKKERESEPAVANVNTARNANAVKKLTWKQARRLEELPGLIESLEAEQSTLHARFADPDFYASETRATDVARDAEIPRELESLYAEWQTLLELT
jgi:ATP-binding cassette subfamily F protein uup